MQSMDLVLAFGGAFVSLSSDQIQIRSCYSRAKSATARRSQLMHHCKTLICTCEATLLSIVLCYALFIY